LYPRWHTQGGPHKCLVCTLDPNREPRSALIPLPELPARAGELAKDRPIVTVCRSGARSAQAVVLLQKAGFKDVANLQGGMLRWRGEGNPVEGSRD